MKNIIKSFGVIIVSIIIIFILFIWTDSAVDAYRSIWNDWFYDPYDTKWVIVVTLYKALYTTFWWWLSAKFAPQKPLYHSWAVWVILFAVYSYSIFVFRDSGINFYMYGLTILVFLCALLGWYLQTKYKLKK